MINGNGTQTEYWGESSGSTSHSSQQDVEDDRMIALVLSEEYAKLDGAVGRRLTNLEPVRGISNALKGHTGTAVLIYFFLSLPVNFLELALSFVSHVPRINSFIPTVSDASMDHQRLLQRLNVYGLCEVKVSGDGNCQFRALSDQLYRSPEHHKHVRKEIVKQLKDHRSLYECYVPMKYKKYHKKMAKTAEWGDHVTLQAAADKFSAKICLLTSFRDTCFIEIMPLYQAPQRELWLSFWSEVHYNSLYEIRVYLCHYLHTISTTPVHPLDLLAISSLHDPRYLNITNPL
ncbi:OTU domain-containing protein [Glycine max]|nr:OTU domain-containing protein [Glycine max]